MPICDQVWDSGLSEDHGEAQGEASDSVKARWTERHPQLSYGAEEQTVKRTVWTFLKS